jgi:hypothetical protein
MRYLQVGRWTLGALAALTAASSAIAQPPARPPAPPAQPRPQLPSPFVVVTENAVRANPADVDSIESIMRAIYDVISGPAGQRRDWNRMRSLFTANARMMPYGSRGLRSGGVEDYISSSGPFLEERGFVEREISRKVEQYGDIAHVFSTYEGRFSAGEPSPIRGINSFQLVRHSGRWWVVSIMWQAETPQLPIPGQYLPAAPAAPAGERG